MFGKTKEEWEGLTGVYTATEITQQPSTWKKTVKQRLNRYIGDSLI